MTSTCISGIAWGTCDECGAATIVGHTATSAAEYRRCCLQLMTCGRDWPVPEDVLMRLFGAPVRCACAAGIPGEGAVKRCKTCGEDKPLTDFYPLTIRGREYRHSSCRPCHKASTAARWRERFATDPEFRERKRERDRLYRAETKAMSNRA